MTGLLQVVVLFLVVTSGIFAVQTNFLNQKQNSLTQLENLDRDRLQAEIRWVAGESQSCLTAFNATNLNLPPPVTIPNVVLRSSGYNVFNLDWLRGPPNPTSRGFLSLTNVNLLVEDCPVGPACTIGIPYSRKVTVNWSANVTNGRTRTLRGSVGPIFVNPAPGLGVTNCSFSQSSTTVSAGVDCFKMGFSGPVGGPCEVGGAMMNKFGLVNPLVENGDMIAAMAYESATNIRYKGCSEYRGILFIDSGPSYGVTCSLPTGVPEPSGGLTACQPLGLPIRKWATGASLTIPPGHPATSVFQPGPVSCPEPGTQMYYWFKTRQMTGRECRATDPPLSPDYTPFVLVNAPNFASCVRLFNN